MAHAFLKKKTFVFALVSVAGIAAFRIIVHPADNRKEIDFNADIRPILNKNCIVCHGGVKQSGEFSLLFRDDALMPNESGKRAIVPGNPHESEMIRRITTSDPKIRMPAEKEPLSKSEIKLLTRWIEQGAKWQDHWAYIKPQAEEPPHITSDWCRNEIDPFILEKLNDHELQPAGPADKANLLRRVSLDLTGLPPTLDELRHFQNDESPGAYEKVVERLLASPHYGERWASVWMDLARYADSKGYEADNQRNIWPYRDWVIRSFNEDKPYNTFVLEQLAGDLLPDPTDDQLIATAFHRNSMNNDEGGTDDEEFRVAAVMDRVNTTWNALQSTTMECVQCHSHPYDPIRHEDYYKFYAFFNNSADEDVPGEHPNLKTFTRNEDRDDLEKIKSWVVQHTAVGEAKEKKALAFVHLLKLAEPKIKAHSFDEIRKGTLDGFKNLAVEDGGRSRLKNVPLHNADNLLLSYVSNSNTGRVEIRMDREDGELLGTWHVKKHQGGRNFETVSVPIRSVPGNRDLFFVFKDPGHKGYICTIEWVLFHERLPGANHKGYQEIEKKFAGLVNAKEVIKTPVMVELPGDYRRKSYVFERGNWMVHGAEVEPGVPETWNAMPDGAPQNRLGMAQWLVSGENPLTARVMVNRLWAQLFGKGIVETLEDFGSQGSPPSHPELLDWLALQFMHSHQWSVKRALKQMVMSATYRQSSDITFGLLEADPDNRLLARGARLRLTAEQVRDQALAVSGLLSNKVYGPSVMPPQPEGVWQVARSSMEWRASDGEDKYRRALYTFWRRTSPYPSMVSFDNPSREFCLTRRINTNTPVQALVLLNDPVYVEAARALAGRMIKCSNGDVRVGIKSGYQIAMAKEKVNDAKLRELELLYAQAVEHFAKNGNAAEEMAGEKNVELAALTVVANAILNLDEFITKS
jgi:hypothetical protein